jgi:hypothetical protein
MSILTSGFISNSIFELPLRSKHTYLVRSQSASKLYANNIWCSILSNERSKHESSAHASPAHAASSTIIYSYTAWSTSLSIWRHVAQYISACLKRTITIQHSSKPKSTTSADPEQRSAESGRDGSDAAVSNFPTRVTGRCERWNDYGDAT